MGEFDITDEERRQLRKVGGIIGAIADEVNRATEAYMAAGLLRVPTEFQSKWVVRHRGQMRAANLVEALACYAAANPDGPIGTLRAHELTWPEFTAFGRFRFAARWRKPLSLSARGTALRAQAPEKTMKSDQTAIWDAPGADPSVTALEPVDLSGTVYINAICQTAIDDSVSAVNFSCPLGLQMKWRETANWDDIVKASVGWQQDCEWLQLARSGAPLRDAGAIPASELPQPPEVPLYTPKKSADNHDAPDTAAGQ